MTTVWVAQSRQTARRQEYSKPKIASQFKEEKLIPFAGVTRKLLSCDLDQQLKVLQEMVRIFQSDEVSYSLMDILVAGLRRSNAYQKIPNAMYQEIESILPSDKELSLKDSVYESRLVEENDRNEIGQTIKKKQKLPITLLRIPTDLQCHLFHYLHWKELKSVQKVCRALCIAARNPLAVNYLEFEPNSSRNGQYRNECYSRPRMLTIHPFFKYLSTSALVGNEKWGLNVVDLRVEQFDGKVDAKFQKLEKCKISWSPNIILNGSISSYKTLRELTLESVTMTESVINQIQKFENLEKLSLKKLLRNPDRLHCSDPVSLSNLKYLSYDINNGGFREFQRFLIGSNPETVDVNTDRFDRFDPSSKFEFLPIPKILHIQQFNVSVSDLDFLVAMKEWLLCAEASNSKLFEQINLNVDYIDDDLVPLLSDVFQHSNKSKLEICIYPRNVSSYSDMENMVNSILDAPFGTFTEIKMEMTFMLLVKCIRYGAYGCELYSKYLLTSLDDTISEEGNKEIIENAVMESIDDAEKWLEPWLLSNQETMKQIGLEKLDVEFTCDLKPDFDRSCGWGGWKDELDDKSDQFRPAINEIIAKMVKDRVVRWNRDHRSCITASRHPKGFTITLSLESHM